MTKTRVWLQGAGLAMLYLLPLIADFLSSSQDGFYHQVMPVTSLTRGVLLDLVLLALVLGAGFAWLRRHTVEASPPNALASRIFCGRLRHGTWFGGAPSQFQSPACTCRAGRNTPHGWFWRPPILLLVIRAALLRSRYKRCGSIADVGGCRDALRRSPATPLCVLQSRAAGAGFIHPCMSINPGDPGEPRILWVLFDEISYNQVFEHRQPDIGLPGI